MKDVSSASDMSSGTAASEDRARPEPVPSARWLGGGTLAAMILVFTGIVCSVSFSVRNDIRKQLMSRDAYVLSLTVQNEIAKAEDERLVFDFEKLSQSDLWGALLETASAKGVFAAQLFGPQGALLESSAAARPGARLSEEQLSAAVAGQSTSAFFKQGSLTDLGAIPYRDETRYATLSVCVPLLASESGQLLGVGRYLLDGRALEAEFHHLDGRLARQAGVAIGGGSALIISLFWLAWRRLELSRAQIAQQANRLRRANVELAMLARTSALGSVTAHLIHGLKNPLAGLRQVVSAAGGVGGGSLNEEEWAGANEAAERMQSMIQEVVGLLQDSSLAASYEMETCDIESELRRKFATVAATQGKKFEVESVGIGSLASHRANMVILIASNLVQNALDAVAAGGSARVFLAVDGRRLILTVRDSGPGIDPELRHRLFAPVPSRKEGGSGIGLAISKQMALHIGADLQYLDTKGKGALFELNVPLEQPDGGEQEG